MPDNSVLSVYAKNTTFQKLPTDRSADTGPPRAPRMSMNSAVGTRWTSSRNILRGVDAVGGAWLPGEYNDMQTTGSTYRKTLDLTRPDPASLWVSVDEHPDGTNDPPMALVGSRMNLPHNQPANNLNSNLSNSRN